MMEAVAARQDDDDPDDPDPSASSKLSIDDFAATPSESALIAFISIPRIETSALETIYGYLVTDWGDRREILRSMLLTSSSSAQINGGRTRWKDDLDQGRGSIASI